MPAVTRLNDMCSGHGCWWPRPAISASNNVFVNGRGVVREGDAYDIHCCKHHCHPGALAKGSSKVFANGKGLGRIGDAVNCGLREAEK